MDDLHHMAARQYSTFSSAQAAACAVSSDALFRAVRRGSVIRLHAGVFAFAGSPDTWERSVMAACLAAGEGGVASHRTAARIWKLRESAEDPIEITVPRTRLPRLQGVTIHRLADLEAKHRTVRQRIPVTNPLRTMVDLGAVLPEEAVEDALDTGLRWPALFSVAAVEATLDDLAKPGRSGAGILRRVLDERVLGDAVSDSELEKRMGALLRRAGLPPAAFHYVVCTPAGVFLAELDFAYPEIKLAIEVDGFGAHGTPRAMAKDFVRQNGLVPYGWRILRFTWRLVTRQPDMVAAAIRAARAGLVAA